MTPTSFIGRIFALARSRSHKLVAGFVATLVVVFGAHGQTSAGNALMFNGGAYVSVSNSAALNLYPLTIMGWVDNQNFGGGTGGLVTQMSFGGVEGYRLFLDFGQLRAAYVRDFGSFVGDPDGMWGGVLPFGWRHVAFTVDASGGSLYIDGELQASQPWTGSPGPTTTSGEVSLGRFFFGALDEVSLWNVALSPAQIAAAARRPIAPNEPGLVAYWPFEEGSGNTTADLAPTAGDNNLGTLFGPAWIQSGAMLSPVVYTFSLLRQTLATATLSGSVTPYGLPTVAWFEWGTNGSFGNSTPPMTVDHPSNPVPVAFEITGLAQGATFVYRLVATNSNGRANGFPVSFTQPIYPGPSGVPHLRSTFYDGTSSSVAFQHRPQWDRAVPMTIEAWIYRHDANRPDTIIGHEAPDSYWLGFGPRLRFSRGGNYAEAPFTVPARKWSHVAVTYDGAIARFYLNGEYRASRSLTNNGAGKIGTLRLGTPTYSPTDRLLGNLDEVRLWSVARGAAEIREGMYRELREGTGLEAVFPRGGYIEELSGEVGASSGVTEQIFGMAPRDLVVPRAAVQPIANGYVELSGEYLGAEQLVLRYPYDPVAFDTVAYFVHTDNDLFVGLRGPRPNSEGWSAANTWLGLFIDSTHGRPALAADPQIQIQAYQDLEPEHRALLNGDGGGGYYYCQRCRPAFGCNPCTPTNLWEVGKLMCEDELGPPCTEFRVSRSLLGTWDEYDGVALGHFNFTPFGDETFIPEDGYADSPATWLTMSYGQGSANLPRVRWTGRVFAGLTNTSPVLEGHRVSLSAGGAIYTNLTDVYGQFHFDVPMPTGQVIYAQIDNVAFGRYRLPEVATSGYQPMYVFTNDVRFPGLPPNLTTPVHLADVDFFVQEPLPASSIVSANPTNPMCGTSVRQGVPGGPGEIVTIFGTNLHAEMEFYLSPYTAVIADPASWTMIRAEVVQIATDRTWVKVQTPYVPEHVRAYANASFIPSFASKWRWVAYDSWFRFGVDTYSYTGEFSIRRAPYPLTHGFNFENHGGEPSLIEFLGCYGYSAYFCVGAFGYCATHVPDPLYWGIWWPVYYFWIKESGGSCVGMAGTSLQLFHGEFHASEFDSDALLPLGIDDPDYPGEWDYSNTGAFYSRPPIPMDIWARVRMNHGVQTSKEYLDVAMSQLSFNLSTDPVDGDPVERLNDIRGTYSYVVSMVPELGKGHAVTPWRVQDGFGGDPNKSRIFVYDNNKPCPEGVAATHGCVTNQWIDIDHTANSYHFRDKGWTGNGLFAVPVRVFNGSRHAPAIEEIETVLLLLVVGSADAHYGSSQGEWGWKEDGTFVNTLPGVTPITPIGSPDNFTRSVPVFLPASNALPTVTMNVRDTNAYLFHAASAGTLLQLELPGGQIGERDQVQLGAHSNKLASFRFTPQNAHSNFIPRIGLQLGSNASATFQWMGLNGESGQPQEFRALKNQRAVEYCNLTTRPTEHYLRIDAVDGGSSNNTCRMFGPFTVPTGAVHCVVLNDWPRVRNVRSELDLNADGTPDQVTTVSGVSIDSDGDGMPDDWETLHQLNPTAVDCDDGADADPDGDGISNYGEYLTETDPRDTASALRLSANYIAGHRVRLSWPAVPGRKYEILYANTLDYIFKPVSGGGFPRLATSAVETYEESLPAPGTQTRFYRLRLVP